jgi:hypothetical protein
METSILRKIIRSESNQLVIDIPENLQNQNLELILLPALESITIEQENSTAWDTLYKNSFLYYMMTHRVPMTSKPFTREEIYFERLH